MVLVNSTPVAAVIPSSSLPDAGTRPADTRSRRRLPVPNLPEARSQSTVYGFAAIDHRGRIADHHLLRALDWDAATRLDIREQGGLLLVAASRQGVFSLTGQGHLRLPVAARRWCGLGTGDRVLLVAEPDQGLLVVHPPAALDAMVGWLHASVLGGDRS